MENWAYIKFGTNARPWQRNILYEYLLKSVSYWFCGPWVEGI